MAQTYNVFPDSDFMDLVDEVQSREQQECDRQVFLNPDLMDLVYEQRRREQQEEMFAIQRRHARARSYNPSRPITPWRHSVVEPTLLTVAAWLIYVLCRLVTKIIKTSAIGWAHGHREIVGWLHDSGERSRADGLRALAALSYMALCSVAIVVAALWVGGVL